MAKHSRTSRRGRGRNQRRGMRRTQRRGRSQRGGGAPPAGYPVAAHMIN